MLRRKNVKYVDKSVADWHNWHHCLGVKYIRAWKLSVETQMAEDCFGHMPGKRGTRCVTLTPPPVKPTLSLFKFVFFWFDSYLTFSTIFSPNYWKKRQKLQNVDISSNSCVQYPDAKVWPPKNMFKLRQIISTDHWQCLPGEQYRRFCLFFHCRYLSATEIKRDFSKNVNETPVFLRLSELVLS